ncbi:hypothetical protein TNCV_3727491 [Trichonephila clavipes]|uniref:Uncharacterized protein n=1 Tax=Trichonephila clavipes TaxID=2585209 RepID=A0A8X6R1M2_TRICX|nr:hypothetical protein TNCV_3727491 [Trichonephila clavipes]
MQRGASQRFNRVPSSSKGRRRVGIVQRMKQEWGKPETRRLKGKKRNGNGQACNGNKPNMKWRQAKHALRQTKTMGQAKHELAIGQI